MLALRRSPRSGFLSEPAFHRRPDYSSLTKALSRPRRRAFESSPSSSPSQTGVAHSRWGAARSPPGWTRGGPRVPSSGSYPARPAPADANEERPLRSARVERRATGTRRRARGAPRDPRRLGSTRAGDDVIARARDRGDPRALVAVAPRSPRVADALVRIARAISGWSASRTRRFAAPPTTTRRRGRGRARRTSSAIASLVARAYEHRVGERARSAPPARPDRSWTTARRSRLSATPAGPRVVNARSAPLWSVRRTRSASPASPSSACATSRVRPRRPRRCPPRATPRFEPRFPPPAVRRSPSPRRAAFSARSERTSSGNPTASGTPPSSPGAGSATAGASRGRSRASRGRATACTWRRRRATPTRSRSSTSPPGAPPGSFTRARRGTAREARPRRSPRAPRPRARPPGRVVLPRESKSKIVASGRRGRRSVGRAVRAGARAQARGARDPRPRSRACA